MDSRAWGWAILQGMASRSPQEIHALLFLLHTVAPAPPQPFCNLSWNSGSSVYWHFMQKLTRILWCIHGIYPFLLLMVACLQRSGILPVATCPVRALLVETIQHLFFECQLDRFMWEHLKLNGAWVENILSLSPVDGGGSVHPNAIESLLTTYAYRFEIYKTFGKHYFEYF